MDIVEKILDKLSIDDNSDLSDELCEELIKLIRSSKIENMNIVKRSLAYSKDLIDLFFNEIIEKKSTDKTDVMIFKEVFKQDGCMIDVKEQIKILREIKEDISEETWNIHKYALAANYNEFFRYPQNVKLTYELDNKSCREWFSKKYEKYLSDEKPDEYIWICDEYLKEKKKDEQFNKKLKELRRRIGKAAHSLTEERLNVIEIEEDDGGVDVDFNMNKYQLGDKKFTGQYTVFGYKSKITLMSEKNKTFNIEYKDLPANWILLGKLLNNYRETFYGRDENIAEL